LRITAIRPSKKSIEPTMSMMIAAKTIQPAIGLFVAIHPPLMDER
jgi:hypothetical protein